MAPFSRKLSQKWHVFLFKTSTRGSAFNAKADLPARPGACLQRQILRHQDGSYFGKIEKFNPKTHKKFLTGKRTFSVKFESDWVRLRSVERPQVLIFCRAPGSENMLHKERCYWSSKGSLRKMAKLRVSLTCSDRCSQQKPTSIDRNGIPCSSY